MCEREACDTAAGLTRRAFLRQTCAVALALPFLPVLADSAAAGPLTLPGGRIRPREDWAQGLAPTGPMATERPEDVRFLLVHHTASSNRYAPEAVPGLIRGFYAMHTGPEKNWPDVAYNFFVDRYGTVWEGRSGSLTGPVQPDATGGSQGFSQLCCFIGDHQVEPPTEEAHRSMVSLLAALADVYGIDTTPGATVKFVSRGSNRWPTGSPVTAATISGHRDMSLTACPGDACYPLVRDVFPAEVSTLRAARSAPSPTPSPTPAASAPASPEFAAALPSSPPPARGREEDEGWSIDPAWLVPGAAVAALASVGLVVGSRFRQCRTVPPLAGTAAGWRVHERAATNGSRDRSPAPRVGTTHEQDTHSLAAVVVAADQPSTAVEAALDAAQRAARETDDRVELWREDPARAAALLVARSLNAGRASAGNDRLTLSVAAVLVLAGTVVVTATEESMGALLTTDGRLLRPELDRPSRASSALSRYCTTCAESEVLAVALASPEPPSSWRVRTQRLPDLCRALVDPVDVDELLVAFQYDFYGATGDEAAVLALVPDAAAPVQRPAPGRR